MEYTFRTIEKKWKEYWKEHRTFSVSNHSPKPKYYVLDMFPYPSGAGLHVGHPLGYIASDIFARYKRLKGFNVLHPMGFDAFGLPAEQYAIETGQHPIKTTEQNINRYREQLDNIGFCYDWERAVRTSDPSYYKWTQWIFLKLFHSWYDRNTQKARPIAELISIFEIDGNANIPCPADEQICFDGNCWKGLSVEEQRDILMKYRLAYLGFADVWWCEALGTVLANDEVVNGVSERGGFPVEKRRMRQWFLRITEYAERLLDGLEALDWTEAMKEMQRNWIGKSIGAEIKFAVEQASDKAITVFTTRPDTIFGANFLVLAPEHSLVDDITTPAQQSEVNAYREYVRTRSERERISEVKLVSGCFTGSFAINPITQQPIPIWIAEYVLAGYGTGAIMAVPSGDQRDHLFAKHFNIPITNIFGALYSGEEAYMAKEGTLENSGFLSGIEISKAVKMAVDAIVEAGVGQGKVNYRLRDAGFSRQRYWGEPFPIVYKEGIAFAIDELSNHSIGEQSTLPILLPEVESYQPASSGEGPLANISDWVNTPVGQRETSTMPGYAGSSWYFLRYMDPQNDHEFAGKKATDYWREVDVYVGGTEHAVGHLLYSRMWTKALYDLGFISFQEPFKKLINQGMIQGSSRFVYRVHGTNQFVTYSRRNEMQVDEIHVDVSLVDGLLLDQKRFKAWRPEFANAEFLLEDDGSYICGVAVEKMSKSKYNVVNPDDIVAQYGADTFRMYEMFLGPIDVSKPWDTKGIEGVHRFLKKLWRLYVDEQKGWIVNQELPNAQELQVIHRTIKKIGEDIERFTLNTSVSQFMICVNELASLTCHKQRVLEPLAILLAPFAPHLAEELWQQLGHSTSIMDASFPDYEEKYITENSKKYPVAVNGKTRVELEFPLDMPEEMVKQAVLSHPIIMKWLEGKAPKKIIFVKGKMINLVV
ncbi:MAG: leucine--tRNA ligase [Bacteroidetes bacterium]|nr:leucine--tRNA ligase [Bacteroidota bacterium]MBS1740843.1 leucine--tRNA ligase [Bacteroidota bacterium]